MRRTTNSPRFPPYIKSFFVFHYFVKKASERACVSPRYPSGISRRGGLWEKIANESGERRDMEKKIEEEEEEEREGVAWKSACAGSKEGGRLHWSSNSSWAQSQSRSFRFGSCVLATFLASLHSLSAPNCPDELLIIPLLPPTAASSVQLDPFYFFLRHHFFTFLVFWRHFSLHELIQLFFLFFILFLDSTFGTKREREMSTVAWPAFWPLCVCVGWWLLVVVCLRHLYVESTSRRRDSRLTRPVSDVTST
jgi:hypothetical protein